MRVELSSWWPYFKLKYLQKAKLTKTLILFCSLFMAIFFQQEAPHHLVHIVKKSYLWLPPCWLVTNTSTYVLHCFWVWIWHDTHQYKLLTLKSWTSYAPCWAVDGSNAVLIAKKHAVTSINDDVVVLYSKISQPLKKWLSPFPLPMGYLVTSFNTVNQECGLHRVVHNFLILTTISELLISITLSLDC